MTALPAITLYQPWATLVAYGCKPFEFRKWAAPARVVGKRVAIHAAARRVSVAELRALLMKLHGASWRETGLLREASIELLDQVKQDPGALPLASVLCTALMGQPIRNAALAAALGLEHVNDSERDEHSSWGWPLTEVDRLKPFVPATGFQGWWTWSAPEP